jgi:signal transduction histidine kinase/CheY-like chemotaxis protein
MSTWSLNNDWAKCILRVTRDPVLITSVDRYVYTNRSFEELCNYACDELLTDPSLLMPAAEHSAFFQIVQKHLSSESALADAIVECLNKSSGPFLARVAFHPFTSEASNSVHCVCVFSEPLFYQPLFENASCVILLLEFSDEDNDLVLLKSNHAGDQLLLTPSPVSPAGARRRVLLQKELGFQFDDEDRLFLSQQRAVGTPYLKQFRVVTPAAPASDLYLAASISYLGRSLKGRSLFTCTADNITEICRLKSQVQESKRFVNAQNTFFVKMVHELRTPLSGMLGISALMRRTLLTAEQSDMLSTLQVCGDSLALLVGNLLDLSNLERNNIVLAQQPFDLLDCLEETLDIAAASASQKEVDLLYELEDLSSFPSTFVIGDCLRLRQVVLNLVSNAVKFTNNGGHIVVTVRRRPTPSISQQLLSSDQIDLEFSVRDDGIGISEKSLPTIFEPFVQSDSSIAHRYGGSGLGLAVVKSLVSLMGGTVHVESKVGIGSVFTFNVILRLSSVIMQLRREVTPSVFSGKRCLIMLRDSQLAQNLQRRLEAFGFVSAIVVSTQNERELAMPFDVLFTEDHFSALFPPDTATSGVVVRVLWLHSLIATGNWRHKYIRKPIRRKQLFDMLCASVLLRPGSSATPPPLPPSPQQSHRPKLRADSPPLRGRILLVDDNIVGRKIKRNLLLALGYSDAAIVLASDGAMAVEIVRSQPIDVVFMDVEMPVLNGLEAARQIRLLRPSTDQRPHIIALTANATLEYQSVCLQAGMNGFLPKPISFDALYEALIRAKRP